MSDYSDDMQMSGGAAMWTSFSHGVAGQELEVHIEGLRRSVEALGTIARGPLGLNLSKGVGLYNIRMPGHGAYSVWSWLVDYTKNLAANASAFISGSQMIQTDMAIDVITADEEKAAMKVKFIESIMDQAQRTPMLSPSADDDSAAVDVFSEMYHLIELGAMRAGKSAKDAQEEAVAELKRIEAFVAAILTDLRFLLGVHTVMLSKDDQNDHS